MEISVPYTAAARQSGWTQTASEKNSQDEKTDRTLVQDSGNTSETPVYDQMDPSEDEEYKTIQEMLAEAKKTTEAYQKALKDSKKRSTSRCGDAPIEAYSRLARAKTVSEVNSATGYARRRLAQLKGLLSADDENAAKIKAAINQLQKAVSRGEKKKRDLNREKRIEKQKARSKAMAERQKQELRRRRTQRSIRESGYLREAHLSDRLASQLTASQMELRQQAQALAGSSAAASLDTAVQQYVSTASVSAPAPAAEIQVQG